MTELGKTKLLCISRAYGTAGGGMERLSYDLITRFENDPSLAVEKIVNEVVAGRSLFSHRIQSLLFAIAVFPKAIVAARQADVIHLGDPLLAAIGWKIQKLWHKPVTVTVHGLDVAYQNSIYQLYLKLFLPQLSKYICISEAPKPYLENMGITNDVVTVTPGIEDRLYDSTVTPEQLFTAVPALPRDAVTLFTNGRVVRRKGQLWFAENVLPLLPEYVHYIVSGDGPDRPALEAARERLHLQDRLHVLGKVDDATLQILLNTTHIFIQPNIAVPGDIEGFGLAPLEAALYGRLVLAANIDGLPTAIQDTKNGFLVESKNPKAWQEKILEIIANKQWTEFGPQARAYTQQKFTWNTCIGEYVTILRSVAKK